MVPNCGFRASQAPHTLWQSLVHRQEDRGGDRAERSSPLPINQLLFIDPLPLTGLLLLETKPNKMFSQPPVAGTTLFTSHMRKTPACKGEVPQRAQGTHIRSQVHMECQLCARQSGDRTGLGRKSLARSCPDYRFHMRVFMHCRTMARTMAR